jgi:dTDP-D-glucose 4,6-dehydratase
MPDLKPIKITNELGWEPAVTFEQGIEKTIQWYNENKDWWQPISKNAEQIAEKYLQDTRNQI